MRTPEGDKIYALLRRHVGQGEAITAPGICRELRWPAGRERLVRNIISSERMLWPGVLCALPGIGYFFAENYEEARATRSWLIAQRTATERTLEDFEHCCAVNGLHMPGDDESEKEAA